MTSSAGAGVQDWQAFLVADPARAASLVSAFGDWAVTGPDAEALGSDRARVEWLHDTGELVAIGAVPVEGTGTAEVRRADGVLQELGALVGWGSGSAAAEGHAEDGGGVVRETFPELVVPEGTRVLVLARLDRGRDVRHLMHGWRSRRGEPGGWEWLRAQTARPA